MSGSAPGLFLCRGCRLHFMLRPVCSLPAARLLPPRGLLTPRSGVGVSPARLGPATRRTGAYRGGTCTRWRHAACRRRPLRPSSVCVTTHHGGEFISGASGLTAATPVDPGSLRPSTTADTAGSRRPAHGLSRGLTRVLGADSVTDRPHERIVSSSKAHGQWAVVEKNLIERATR